MNKKIAMKMVECAQDVRGVSFHEIKFERTSATETLMHISTVKGSVITVSLNDDSLLSVIHDLAFKLSILNELKKELATL
jgi:hypothetical protein